jgi:adenylate cyclase class IV
VAAVTGTVALVTMVIGAIAKDTQRPAPADWYSEAKCRNFADAEQAARLRLAKPPW